MLGGPGDWAFASDSSDTYPFKGLYAYSEGEFAGRAYWGSGGSVGGKGSNVAVGSGAEVATHGAETSMG